MASVKSLNELRDHPITKEIAAIFTGRDRGRLIFFGAGFSMTAGVKGWRDLLSDLNSEAKKAGKITEVVFSEIESMINDNKLIMAAYLLEKKMGVDLFHSIMKKNIYQPQFKYPPHLSKALIECCDNNNLTLLLTTNFDCLLEETLNSKDSSADYWVAHTWKKTELVRDEQPQNSRIIYKIHGEIHDPESIVFNLKQFADLYFMQRNFTFSLAKLFDSNSVLFIGFSLDDPFFSAIIDTLASYFGSYAKRHYAIMSNISEAEREAWADLRNVEIISFDSTELKYRDVYKTLLEEITPKAKGTGGVISSGIVVKVEELQKDREPDTKVTMIQYALDNREGWSDGGGNPEIVEDGDRKVLRVNCTLKSDGKKTNCSIKRRLGTQNEGTKVRADVYFKCKPEFEGMLFFGDARSAADKRHYVYRSMKGKNKWQKLTGEVTYHDESPCSIFLYGNRNKGKNGDFVLYRDLKLTVFEKKIGGK